MTTFSHSAIRNR